MLGAAADPAARMVVQADPATAVRMEVQADPVAEVPMVVEAVEVLMTEDPPPGLEGQGNLEAAEAPTLGYLAPG